MHLVDNVTDPAFVAALATLVSAVAGFLVAMRSLKRVERNTNGTNVRLMDTIETLTTELREAELENVRLQTVIEYERKQPGGKQVDPRS